MKLELNKEYYCWYTDQILEFVGWFKENKTPYVKNNYNKSFNLGKDKRTWSLKYLKETNQEQINYYKNRLHNSHEINNIYIDINQDGDNYIHLKEEVSLVSVEDLEKAVELLKKGFVKKY